MFFILLEMCVLGGTGLRRPQYIDTVTSNPYPQIPVPRDPTVGNEKRMDNAVAKPSGKQPTYWLENAPSTVQVGRYYVTCGRWATWVKGNIAASRPD